MDMALNLLRHLIERPGQIAELVGSVRQASARCQISCCDCCGLVCELQDGLREAFRQQVRKPGSGQRNGRFKYCDDRTETGQRRVGFRRVDLDDQSPVQVADRAIGGQNLDVSLVPGMQEARLPMAGECQGGPPAPRKCPELWSVARRQKEMDPRSAQGSCP